MIVPVESGDTTVNFAVARSVKKVAFEYRIMLDVVVPEDLSAKVPKTCNLAFGKTNGSVPVQTVAAPDDVPVAAPTERLIH